jgi:hypothetical protein
MKKAGRTHLNCRTFLMRAARRGPLHAGARALPEMVCARPLAAMEMNMYCVSPEQTARPNKL